MFFVGTTIVEPAHYELATVWASLVKMATLSPDLIPALKVDQYRYALMLCIPLEHRILFSEAMASHGVARFIICKKRVVLAE